MLTKKELLSESLSDKQVSEVLYRGNWQEIEILKDTPRFKEYDPKVWIYVAKDYEFFMMPWYPLFLSLFILTLSLVFNFVSGTLAVIVTVLSLLYITYGIPLLHRIKERNRIKLLNEMLTDTPYHMDLYVVPVVEVTKSALLEDEEVVEEKPKKKSFFSKK